MSQRTSHLLAVLAYAVLAAALSADVLRDPARTTFPSFSEDNFLGFWNLWWASESLFQWRDPFFTDLFFHPTGTTLVLTEFTPLFGLLAAPLVRVLGQPEGAVLAHNLLIVLSFVLTGYATFLFATWLTASRAGGFAAGLLMAFCAFRLHHLEHLNLLSTHWLPLAAWLIGGWLLEGRRAGEEAPPAPSRWRLLWIGLLGFGLTATSFSVASMTGLFVASWLILTAILRAGTWRPGAVRRVLLAAGAFALGALPLSLAWLAGGESRIAHPTELVRWSPDLLGFVTPQDSALLGPLVEAMAAGFHRPSGEEVYLGWALLVAAALGMAALRRKGIPLLATALFALLLSLGPGIWIAGTHHPYAPNAYDTLLGIAPVLQGIRTPNRFVVVALMALVPLAAAGVGRLATRRAGRWAIPALAVLALVELVPDPITAVPAKVPDVFRRIGADSAPGALIELPLRDINDLNRAAFHQLAHRRPIPGGPLIRPTPEARSFELRENLHVRLSSDRTIPGAVADLRRLDVAFVVWHRRDIEPGTWTAIRNVFSELAELWHEEPTLLVFRL